MRVPAAAGGGRFAALPALRGALAAGTLGLGALARDALVPGDLAPGVLHRWQCIVSGRASSSSLWLQACVYYGLQANMLTTLGGRLDAPSVVGKALGVRPATAAVAPGYMRLQALPHRIAASPYRW